MSHRVGPPTEGPRPLLVKFVSRRSKARVMEVKKHLKKLSPPPGAIGASNGDEEAGSNEASAGTGTTNETGEGPTETSTSSTDGNDETTQKSPYPYKKPLFFQDDLTKARASLFYLARKSKQARRLSDTWTHDGKVLVKDLHNRVYEIKTESDLRSREQQLVSV